MTIAKVKIVTEIIKEATDFFHSIGVDCSLLREMPGGGAWEMELKSDQIPADLNGKTIKPTIRRCDDGSVVLTSWNDE